MKIYITAHFKEDENKAEIEQLCDLVHEAGFEDFCFIRDIDHYKKVFDDPRELMTRAKSEVLRCDALWIDFATSSTARVIETGIAFGAGKKIIVLVKKGIQLKDTAKGVADKIIEYDDITEIVEPLREFLREVGG